jgi:hypothetical protein
MARYFACKNLIKIKFWIAIAAAVFVRVFTVQ